MFLIEIEIRQHVMNLILTISVLQIMLRLQIVSINFLFVNVGPNLAKSTTNVNVNPTSYIHNENCNSMFINPVTSNEVQNTVMSKESTPDEDDITSQIILKYTLKYFVEPLTHSVNLSLSQGIFPQELKIAKVIPLY